MATTVKSIADFLNQFAPLELAEEWDNVGLLLGEDTAHVEKVLTCLTLTEDVADEAVAVGANMIVSHHPIMFRKVQRLTNRTTEGRIVWKLASAGIAVHSPHTSHDSAASGVNQQLATRMSLAEIGPIRPRDDEPARGSGRLGTLAASMSLPEFLEHVKSSLGIERLQFASGDGRSIAKVAVACGSAAEFLGDADRKGCDVLVTGEARFHALLEARSRGVAMVLLGHYDSERPSMESLAEVLGKQFTDVTVEASSQETDPLEWA